MQRIIKFRAWCQDFTDFKMCYYQYHPCDNGLFFNMTTTFHSTDVLQVMQFTGAKDDAGLEIYEGDIISDGDGKIYVVEWNDDTCKFQYSDGSDINDGDRYNTSKGVIGNIYENPNLILE